jgi:hypothetical protein
VTSLGQSTAARWLERLHGLSLGILPVVAFHRYRYVVWQAPAPPINTPVEFLGIVLFLPDAVLALVVALTLARVVIDSAYAKDWADTFRRIVGEWGGIWWVALFVWMGIGTLWAANATLTRYATLHVLAQFSMAVVLAVAVRRGQGFWILAVFVAGATIQAAIAIGQTLVGGTIGLAWLGEFASFTKQGDVFRAYGLTDNPNSLGGYLMVALFASLGLAWYTRQTGRSLALPASASSVIGVGLLTTASRGALAATIIGLLPLGMQALRRYPPSRRASLGLVMGAALIAATGGILLGDTLQARLEETINPPDDAPEGYFLGRNFYTVDTNRVIAQSPVLGVGANNLMLEIAHLRPGFYDTVFPVHNGFWLIRAELGLPGLLLISAACLSTLIGLRNTAHTVRFVWACCFLGICLIMLVEFYMWASPHSRVLLFYVLGLYWGSYDVA